MQLYSFHGGVELPGHKLSGEAAHLAVAPVPAQLVFPLQQRPGVLAVPTVQPGERVLKGQPIARAEGPRAVPLHASSSGVVRELAVRPIPHPSGLSDLCIVIDTDGLDEAAPFAPPLDADSADPAAILERIREAGIVGLGGAGFPTHVKIGSNGRRPPEILVLNGAECEPYISCDDCLMQHYAAEVVAGGRLLMRLLGVARCLIGIEDDMTGALAAMREAAATVPGMEVVAVPVRYPTGGERQLIQVLTGREVPSRGIPADIGVICQNVGTAAAIHRAVRIGMPLVERIVTVSGGAVRRRQNVLARIGTPVRDLIDFCGGYADEPGVLVMGGPMMGHALSSDELPIVKSTNCLLAGAVAELSADKEPSPCIRCGACAAACPVNLLPQQLYWQARAQNWDKARGLDLFDCIECGCCDVVCPSHIPLVQYFRAAKGHIVARDREKAKADHARIRHEAHQARIAREKAEKEARLARKKATLSGAADSADNAAGST